MQVQKDQVLNAPRILEFRRRFLRDVNLPITIVQSPYFEYYLHLYEPLFQSKTTYDSTLKVIDTYFNSNSQFLANLVSDIIHHLVHDMESLEIYKEYFNKEKPEIIWPKVYQSKINPPSTNNPSSSSIINSTNNGIVSNEQEENKAKEEKKENLEKNLEKILPNVNGREVYSGLHNDFVFVSIDMSSANFSTLKVTDKNLVMNCNSYRDLIIWSTVKLLEQKNIHPKLLNDIKENSNENEFINYLTNAKQIRQVIFGKLNPKRQQTLQKFTMRQLIKIILETELNKEEEELKEYLQLDRIISCTSDEIVFMITNPNLINKKELLKNKRDINEEYKIANKLMKLFRNIINNNNYLKEFKFRIEGFKLEQISSTKIDRSLGFVKKFITNEMLNEKEENEELLITTNSEHKSKLNVEFKGVTQYLYPQVVKHYFGLEINEMDRKFLHDGQFLATLDECYFF
ncbi:hypothetical protein ABK040_004267 [Willaertia magna]